MSALGDFRAMAMQRLPGVVRAMPKPGTNVPENTLSPSADPFELTVAEETETVPGDPFAADDPGMARPPAPRPETPETEPLATPTTLAGTGTGDGIDAAPEANVAADSPPASREPEPSSANDDGSQAEDVQSGTEQRVPPAAADQLEGPPVLRFRRPENMPSAAPASTIIEERVLREMALLEGKTYEDDNSPDPGAVEDKTPPEASRDQAGERTMNALPRPAAEASSVPPESLTPLQGTPSAPSPPAPPPSVSIGRITINAPPPAPPPKAPKPATKTDIRGQLRRAGLQRL